MRCPILSRAVIARIFLKDLERYSLPNLSPWYSEWLGRWIKNFVIAGAVDVVILGAALYFLYSPLTLIAAVLLYSVPLYILMMMYSRRVSQFKQEWREQHPSLTLL